MDLIVAADARWGIGKNNELLYHIPEDMRFFRKMTVGKNVVCGRKTLLSFPGSKPLPGRRHFVLTRGDLPPKENLTVVHSLEELMKAIADLPEDEVFVIGGDSAYRQLYKFCKRAFVTKIFSDEKEADAFFPDLDQDPDFVLSDPGEIRTTDEGLRYAFTVYENHALAQKKNP